MKVFSNIIEKYKINTIPSKIFWRMVYLLSTVPKTAFNKGIGENKVLIFQLLHLGDLVISIPLINYLSNGINKNSVDILVSEKNLDLANRIKNINKVYFIKGDWNDRVKHEYGYLSFSEIVQFIKMIYVLYQNKYAKIYLLNNDEYSKLFVNLINWGTLRQLPNENLYFKNIKGKDTEQLHQSDYIFSIIDDYKIPIRQRQNYDIAIWNGERDKIADLISPYKIKQKIIVLHVDARVPAKSWADHNWEAVITFFTKQSCRIFIIGSKSDKHRRRLFPIGVTDIRGMLSIGELIVLLSESDLFIGTDSGPGHLTNISKTPSIILFSAANSSQWWKPLNPNAIVITKEVACHDCHKIICPYDNLCMNLIKPKEVILHAKNILNQPME
jgi:heptosyltransferase-2